MRSTSCIIENKQKSKKKFGQVLVFIYFLFCSIIHDPKVLVDDTSNTPFFNQILLSQHITVFTGSNSKLKELKKSEVIQNIYQFINPNFHLELNLYSFYFLLFFIFILRIITKKIQVSISIRAPANN